METRLFTSHNYLLLKSVVFISGATVLSLEILGSRLLAPYFGNSLFVWGSLIGVVLTALSIGYYYGGKISVRSANFPTLCIMMFGAGAYVFMTTVLMTGIFEATLMLRLGERYGPLAATTLFLGPPSVLLGMVSPYTVRLKTKALHEVGATAGSLYSLSTVGSIVGTFITVFVLIPSFELSTLLYGISIILMGVSIIGLTIKLKATAVFFIIVALIFSSAAQPLPAGVVFQKETLYHRLVVHDNPVTGVRTLILDNNFHSAMNLRNPAQTVFVYTDFFHMGFLFNTNISHVLFVGGGGFTGPKKFLADYPGVTVDVVEIDPEVVEAAKQYFSVFPSDRLKIYVMDARVFLKETDMKYDLIVLDAYARTYIPFHLMTVEFFREVYNHLTPKGVMVSNVIGSLEGVKSEIVFSQYVTVANVFSSTYLFPVSTASSQPVQNIILIASKEPVLITQQEIVQRAQSLSGKVNISNFVKYAGQIFTEPIDQTHAYILTDQKAPVENLVNPLTGVSFLRETEDQGTVTVEALGAPSLNVIFPTRQNSFGESLLIILTATVLMLLVSVKIARRQTYK